MEKGRHTDRQLSCFIAPAPEVRLTRYDLQTVPQKDRLSIYQNPHRCPVTFAGSSLIGSLPQPRRDCSHFDLQRGSHKSFLTKFEPFHSTSEEQLLGN